MKKDKPTDRQRIEHILEAIGLIRSFSAGHTQSSFLEDNLALSACLYQYVIIGEAARHIDPDILKKYPYPWHKVKGFRNYIIHEYFGIELRLAWHTTQDILPQLEALLREILENEF